MKVSLERRAKQTLEFFYKDTGLLAKSGKRARFNAKELDSIFDEQSFIVECEIDEGLLDANVTNSYKHLEQRVAEITGYTINHVRRLCNEWEVRQSEVQANDRTIESENL